MDDTAPNALYLALLLVLVGSSLIGMRLPLARALKMALAWVAIFGVVFILFAFRDDFSALGQRLRAEATGAPIEQGEELRVPIASDGHFWVEAAVNDHKASFLVDSGASTTTISRATAEDAGVEVSSVQRQVNTANGVVRMNRARVERLRIGGIERADLGVFVNNSDDTNVLGMNFLSSLSGWRVEGNYLVLRP